LRTAVRNTLLETIANSFKVEAGNTSDVSVALFGREAEQGMRLLQILDRQYAVVVTNPPYLGNKYMNIHLKKYIEKYFPSGKRDLYTTFILRCTQLCRSDGRVAMVTMQGWMFLRSFTELRAIKDEKLIGSSAPNKFKGFLRDTSIEALAHLGRYAFSEIVNAVVAPLLFVVRQSSPTQQHQIWSCRLTAPRPSEEQGLLLANATKAGVATGRVFTPYQIDFLTIPGTPIVYWLKPSFFVLLKSSHRMHDIADVRQGLATADDNRFLRYTWEVTTIGRWATFTKGGGYCKWFGQNWYYVDWEYSGTRIKAFGKGFISNIGYYFSQGWSYSRISNGSIGFRRFDIPGCIGDKGPGIYTEDYSLPAIAQSHTLSFLLRAVSPQLAFEVNTLVQAPLPDEEQGFLAILAKISESLKRLLISHTLIERTFIQYGHSLQKDYLACLLHSVEGMIEENVCYAYKLSEASIHTITEDTGTPAGWYPLIVGYDTLPTLPDNIDIPQLPQELFTYLAEHKRIAVSDKELARIKSNLKALYEPGPHAKGVEQEEREETAEEGEEEMASGAHIPIPTETFLEELSVKMELHPISVYWLLEELRAEGVRCRPEEKRLLEDRLSVLVLRLLGHRWPKQLEAGEPVPTWADEHGIIPLVPGTGRATLAERVRERLQLEDGALETQKTEALLHELTGKTLEQWLRSNFFSKHIQQFKSRPIAWHLASTPIKGETGTAKKKRDTTERTTRGPAFECLLYYHACSRSALTRIRTQYIEPLLRTERARVEQGGSARSAHGNGIQQETLLPINDNNASTFAKMRIRELEDFAMRLQQIEESGFDTPELRTLLMAEPLDRWSGDGQQAPKNQDEFYRDERAWHVDINDGVRVNIAPLQLAGVLTNTVLAKSGDAKKALVDRARWRADERRWVRAGKLPRCGWMDEQVQASAAWMEHESSHVQDTLTQQPLTVSTGENEG